jgi:hypothetical protein
MNPGSGTIEISTGTITSDNSRFRTKEQGIEYSPELEREFDEKYEKLAMKDENKSVDVEELKNPVATFTDASFGVTYRELKSISGIVIYLHGTPVAWKSKVQTVFASSTTQAEWIALADGIEMAQSVHALRDFFYGTQDGKKGPIWCDNLGAVRCARKGPGSTEEIPKKTRHVALRWARVLEEQESLFFCPTHEQRADGLTKSCNPRALNIRRVEGLLLT